MSRTVGTQSTTPARVATSASPATLSAASANRAMLRIYNESSVILYVKFGSAASSTDYTFQMAAGAYYESPAGDPYSGIVTGTLASSTGFAQVTSY